MSQQSEDMGKTPPAGGPPLRTAQAENGKVSMNGTAVETPGGPAPRRRRGRAVFVLPVIALALVLGGYFGYNYLQDQNTYVSTENAQVAGALVQVGSLNAGQIGSVSVDVGDRVKRDQTVAEVTLPSPLAVSPGGTAKLGFRGTDDQRAQVVSPIDGVVVSRSGNPGDTIAAGQPILTVVDPAQLWVQAQVEETKIARVQVGQPVEVTVDTLGKTLPGRVVAIGRASAGTFSLMPQGNTSGNFTKVTQVVPVKIAVNYGDLPLTLGTSVTVKIRVQE